MGGGGEGGREKGEEEERVKTLGKHWRSRVRVLPKNKEIMSKENNGLSTKLWTPVTFSIIKLNELKFP